MYPKLQISTKTALTLLCLLQTGLVQAQDIAFVSVCDRTAQVRDYIVGEAPVDACELVTAAHLAGISSDMDLSGQDITALKAGDFQGLTTLRSLNLSNNQLTMLPASVFSGSTISFNLSLSNNQLTTLETGTFNGLTLRGNLSLSNNQLTTLETGTFNGLTLRGNLSLSNNNLITLPADVFDGLSISSLFLSNNKLTTLPAGIFSDFTLFGSLALSDNNLDLTTLPAGIFSDLTFGALLLSSNNLTELPANVFFGLTLGSLFLNKNQLTTLPAGMFSDFTLSGDLNLSFNNLDLTTLPPNIFSGLTFNNLDLQRNNLITLPAGIFSDLTLNDALNLSTNQLTTLPPDVFSNLTLRHLRISDNQLTTLPAGIFSGLTFNGGDLSLNRNRMTTLPASVFSGLSIRDLNLSYNRLTTLPADVFSGLSLKSDLRLQGNPNAPFPLTVELEPGDAPGKINLKLAQGMPRALTVPITVSSGTITPDQASFDFAAGSTTSDIFTVTPAESGITTITIGDLPDLPAGYLGLKLEKEAPLAPFANMYFTGGDRNLADAKVLYYALSPELSDTTRTRALNSVATDASDAVQNMVIVVNSLVRKNPEILDFNKNNRLDIQDAAIFYYALALPASLGNGTENSGSAAIRKTILGPFMDSAHKDPDLRDILRTINGL